MSVRAVKETGVLGQSNRQIVVVLLCALGVLAAAAWWMADGEHEPVVLASGAAPGAAADTQAAPRDPHPRAGNDPNSNAVVIDIEGARLDAARLFDLGFAGGLNIDRETRSTLDALLIAMPDAPAAQDIEKLEQTLRNGLPKEDAEKAIKMFHGYRAYQADMKIEAQQLGIPETPQATDEYFDKLALIQRRHFDDATAAGLFAQENLNARLTMQASFISNDPALGPGEKKERLDALRAQLPDDLRTLIPEPEAPPAQQ